MNAFLYRWAAGRALPPPPLLSETAGGFPNTVTFLDLLYLYRPPAWMTTLSVTSPPISRTSH